MRKIHIQSVIALSIVSLVLVPGVFAANYFGGVKRLIRDNYQHNSTPSSTVRPTHVAGKGIHLQNLENKIATRVGAIKNFFSSHAMLVNATIATLGTNTMTVTTTDAKTITVNADKNTRDRRRFFGTANWSEFAVGNKVNVFGRWTDDAHTTILATQIRDLSIQKRFGVFVGDVTGVNGNTITLKTINRGTQNVTVSSTTKFVDRRNKNINQTNVVVGHRIRVKGMWDSSNNTITEVTQVKDYNLPVKLAATPTPTSIPVPTVTPTPTTVPTATPTP